MCSQPGGAGFAPVAPLNRLGRGGAGQSGVLALCPHPRIPHHLQTGKFPHGSKPQPRLLLVKLGEESIISR